MTNEEQIRQLRKAADEVLHDPVKIRVAVALLLAGVWYAAAFRPISRQIAEAGAGLEDDRETLDLAREVEHLRAQAEAFRAKLPGEPDSNEWVRYLMDGIREQLPGRPVTVEPQGEGEVGPFVSTAVRVKAEGPFEELERFVRWVESSPRMLLIESIQLDVDDDAKRAPGDPPMVFLQMTVMGVIG